MERSLKFKCPSCQKTLAKVEGMEVATQVVERTCSGCRETWRLVIQPNVGNGMATDVATFTFLGRKLVKVGS